MDSGQNSKPRGKGWKRYRGGWGKNIRFVRSKEDPRFLVMTKADLKKPFEYRSDFVDIFRPRTNFKLQVNE